MHCERKGGERANLIFYQIYFELPQVGDDSGTVRCFEMKRGEAQTVFSFRFADGTGNSHSGSAGTGNMVTAVAMGGRTGGPGGGDRVFATQVGP